MTVTAAQTAPDWVVAEMPAGYQNRVAEIQRLVADLQHMGQFARLLCQVGPQLAEAIRNVFVALRFEAEWITTPGPSGVSVRLEGGRHLLLHASESPEPISRKSQELAHVFHLLHEVAGDSDKVVLVTNVEPERRPADRPAPVTPDAIAFLARLGVVHVPAPTLFALWKLSLDEPDRARGQVEHLYAHDAGTFALPDSLFT
jgi:hypothetical protein